VVAVTCTVLHDVRMHITTALEHDEFLSSSFGHMDVLDGCRVSMSMPLHEPWSRCRRLCTSCRAVVNNGRHQNAEAAGVHRVAWTDDYDARSVIVHVSKWSCARWPELFTGPLKPGI
jgi:hypothetical protein